MVISISHDYYFLSLLAYLSIYCHLGCEDVQKCKCKLEISTVEDDHITNLVLGQDSSLNINFRLSNVGDEPAIGTNFSFALPLDLDIIDDEDSHCKKHFKEGDNEGSGEIVCITLPKDIIFIIWVIILIL